MNSEYRDIKDQLKTEHNIEPMDSLLVTFMPLDLTSINSTLNFVQLYLKTGRNLHVLVLNAGIAMVPYGKSHFDIRFV